MSEDTSRRTFLKVASSGFAATLSRDESHAAPTDGKRRPAPADRRYQSAAVEEFLANTSARIKDTELSGLLVNCYPNTLDTTVEPGRFEGKPDTAVITGDIPAMWLRDSSAQVWPYLPLATKD